MLDEAIAKYRAIWDRWSQTATSSETPGQAEYREKYGQRVNYLRREEVDAAVRDCMLAAAAAGLHSYIEAVAEKEDTMRTPVEGTSKEDEDV